MIPSPAAGVLRRLPTVTRGGYVRRRRPAAFGGYAQRRPTGGRFPGVACPVAGLLDGCKPPVALCVAMQLAPSDRGCSLRPPAESGMICIRHRALPLHPFTLPPSLGHPPGGGGVIMGPILVCLTLPYQSIWTLE